MLLSLNGNIVHDLRLRCMISLQYRVISLTLKTLQHFLSLSCRSDQVVLVKDRAVHQVLLVLRQNVAGLIYSRHGGVWCTFWYHRCSCRESGGLGTFNLNDLVFKLNLDAFVVFDLTQLGIVKREDRRIQELVFGELSFPMML